MSNIISSAVAGRATAPRVPVRRRAPQKKAEASNPAPAAPEAAQHEAASPPLQTPPATQVTATQSANFSPEPSTPEQVPCTEFLPQNRRKPTPGAPPIQDAQLPAPTQDAPLPTPVATQVQQVDPDATPAPEPVEAPPPKRKRTRKSTPKAKHNPGEDGQDDDHRRREQRERREREREAHQHDPAATSMWELARDSRNGQVSERERQMRQIDWDEVKQKRREAEDQLVADAQERQERNREQRYIQLGLALPDAGNDETEDAQAEDGTAEGESAGETAGETAEGETAETEQPTRAGPALRIVNGEIMLDEEAPEEAPPEDDYADILAQEDADLTVRRNRMVGINNRRREPADRLPPARKRGGKTRNGAWTTEETDMLYQHMRMWGTDFEMIAQMMPNRTRAQVKRKFLAEEKLDPVRMRETFMAKPIPMSIDYYAEHTGRDKSVYTQYEGLDDCMNQIKETVADVRRQKEQREEEARQQVQKDQDEAEARKASAKRKREGKKRKREAEVQLEDE